MEANGGDGAVALEQAPVVDSTLVSTLNDNADAPDQQPQLTESAQEETTEAVNELQSPPPPTAADSKPEESDEDQSVEAGGEASGVEAKTDEMKEVQQEAAEGVDTPVPTETETADDTTTPATEQDSGIQDEQEVNESAMDIENNSGDAGEDKEVPLESNGGLSPPAHDDDEYDPSAPTHDDDEYDPSMPTIDTSSVPHGEDEYDPANPSPAGTPVAGKTQTDNASVEPTAEREEYDPDHPSMSAAAAEEPVAMEVDHSTASADQASVTPAKRKADEETAASTEVPSNGRNDKNEPKRPRNDDSDKTSPRGHEEHKNHHRGHGESSSPSSRKHRNHEEDHKGLSPAAWDRLMDFQAGSEFRVTQVSRAAFASVGAMPEFAQIAIIARFVRTPLQEVRDKNGQLMRIYREYQKENPQVAALQPVDAFISDYKTDPGLFRFGYAPPQPTTGISNVRIPYQRDHKLNENTAPKKSSQQAGNSTAKQTEQQQDKDVDEFGRALHHDKATVSDSSEQARAPSSRTATDPRLASRGRQGPTSPNPQAAPQSAVAPRNEDPRRREQPQPNTQSTNGAGRDPRRRGSATTQQSPRGGQGNAPRAPPLSELYERLPPSVKSVLDNMRHEGRLHQTLNDNVISRLLHLPERVALQAVENFSNVDLSHVGNLQGFLVGIINRVQEKLISSEKQHRQQVPSPRGQSSAGPGGYPAPSPAGSVLGGPPQANRLGGMNGANGPEFRGQGAPMAPGPSPALYERPYDAPQDPRRRQPPPQSGPAYGAAVRGAPSYGPGRGPVGMPSFTALPLSVQNHVHSLVANGTLASVEELGGKCYEVLNQLSEPLANQVLVRFAGANLSNVRNRSGFLIGVVKRCRQEYGFNN